MSKKDDSIKTALGFIEEVPMPTEQQKDKMLNHVLAACREETVSGFDSLREIVITYPWRFAFTASAIQAVILTMIFGTQYTNLFLGFFGG